MTVKDALVGPPGLAVSEVSAIENPEGGGLGFRIVIVARGWRTLALTM